MCLLLLLLSAPPSSAFRQRLMDVYRPRIGPPISISPPRSPTTTSHRIARPKSLLNSIGVPLGVCAAARDLSHYSQIPFSAPTGKAAPRRAVSSLSLLALLPWPSNGTGSPIAASRPFPKCRLQATMRRRGGAREPFIERRSYFADCGIAVCLVARKGKSLGHVLQRRIHHR